MIAGKQVDEDGHLTIMDIMDFGLARPTEVSRSSRTDETVGTVAFMSPEQTEDSGTDHRTEIRPQGLEAGEQRVNHGLQNPSALARSVNVPVIASY